VKSRRQPLAAEKQAIADYEERLGQAAAFGDVGLKLSLENQIADETRHKEEIESVLAGESRQPRRYSKKPVSDRKSQCPQEHESTITRAMLAIPR
jgi:rubrerythrin